MHLDFRFYVKFRNADLWRKWHQNIVIEAANGEEYSLLEISKVFSDTEGMMRLMEPIGMVFETVTAVEKKAYCFIHDRQKSYDFFTRLTDYLFDEVMKIAENDAVMIADLTDYDTDMMGDHIRYYLGGGPSAVQKCVVEGPDGLDHHQIEISNFSEMLQYEKLSDAQKERLTDLTGNTYPKDLMDPLRTVEVAEDLDLSAELAFAKEQFSKHTDEELLKLCAEQPFLSDAEIETVVDGAPDREKIAKAYIDALMEHGGVEITGFSGFYQGNLKQFKRFAKADIDELF